MSVPFCSVSMINTVSGNYHAGTMIRLCSGSVYHANCREPAFPCLSYLRLAGNEGMEKKMETTVMGYKDTIRTLEGKFVPALRHVDRSVSKLTDSSSFSTAAGTIPLTLNPKP